MSHRLVQNGGELTSSTHERKELNDDRRGLVLEMKTEQRE